MSSRNIFLIMVLIFISLLFIRASASATSSSTLYISEDALAAKGNTASNFLTFVNSTVGVRIQYPSNWIKVENGTTSANGGTLTNVVTFGPPMNNKTDQFPGLLSLTVVNLPNVKNITRSIYANKTIYDLERSFQDLKITESNANTTSLLAHNPAYQIVYTGKPLGIDITLKSMEIFTIKANKIYAITYIADESRYSRYLPTIKDMIDSFEITR